MSDPPTLADAQSLPLRIRVSLWMQCGAALGLPVDDLVTAVDQQLAAAQRSLRDRHLRMSVAEHVAHARVVGDLRCRRRAAGILGLP